jgi:cell division septation protein DedD
MRLSMGRLSLILIGVAFLLAAAVWQSQIKRSFKSSDLERHIKREKIQKAAKREALGKSARKREEGVPKSPKTPRSVAKPGNKGTTSISVPPPVVEKLRSPETPADKRGTPGAESEKGPKGASKRPEGSLAMAKLGVNSEGPERLVPHEKALSYPYSIQLGSFRGLKVAKGAISLYNKKGLSPYWVKVELATGTWYRVYVGYFVDAEKAERFREAHGIKGSLIKKTRYATLVGTYTSSNEIEGLIQSLKDLGFAPYVIKNQSGKSQIFIGAFITKEGAEKQQAALESRGIQSRAVER